MPRKFFVLPVIFILLASACGAPKSAEPTQTAMPTATQTPTSTPLALVLPLSDSEVLRTTVKDAKAAFDNGTAILVDVRAPSSFEMSHISGAINISLSDIEFNPTGVKLDKSQWIITYCT